MATSKTKPRMASLWGMKGRLDPGDGLADVFVEVTKAGGAAAGVLAGGMLTTWLGWRSVFLVNVPVGVVAGLLSLRLVPPSRAAAKIRRELDLPGALLVVAGLVTGVYALAGTPEHGWGSSRTYPLPEVPEAIRHLEDGRAQGKLAITI